jgi:protein bicaudal C
MSATCEINNTLMQIQQINTPAPKEAKRLHSSSSQASSGVHCDSRNSPSHDSDSHSHDALNSDSGRDSGRPSKSTDAETPLPKDNVLPEGHSEERFRVDRKRLEQLLSQSVKMENALTRAEAFFQEVMNSTSTQVSWPSRLKVGAKSKKDPHIKITGPTESVKIAKAKIMQQLDSKSSRVTLKMDVSHSEHSHVIGKGGANIKAVMKKTECHIHFPDSNRNSNVTEKSNQVSIAGQASGVEMSRQQIRELLPIALTFEVATKGHVDLTSPAIQQIVQTYNISVQAKAKKMYSTVLQVKGSVANQIALKEGTICLMQALTGQVGQTVPVTCNIEIQNVASFMNAKSVAKIKAIQANSGINIDFPSEKTNDRMVTMSGSCEGVLYARQEIISHLPLVLMFDLKEDVSQIQALQIGEKYECFVSIKAKAKQVTKSCIIKSSEANVYNMFKARQTLMNLDFNGLEDIPMPVNTASFLFNQKLQSVAVQMALPKAATAPVQQNLMAPKWNTAQSNPNRRSLQISAKSINSSGRKSSMTPSTDSANSSQKSPSIDSNDVKESTRFTGIIRQPKGPTKESSFAPRKSLELPVMTGIKIAAIQNKATRESPCTSKDECISTGNECHSSDLSDNESKHVVSESYYKPISFRVSKVNKQTGNVSYSETSDNSDEQVASKNQKFSSNMQSKNNKAATKSQQVRMPTTLEELFKNINLEKYIESFVEQEIDVETFMSMSDNDLREMGVNTFGARRKMSMAIKELNTMARNYHTSTAKISLRVGGK